ncbi:MAG TPA: hypothetical protein VN493_02150 [Thermoanaerobaculia bacterium]|nr:hypothetical protein [Thermoanaerobaculia bacterium]
MVSEQFVKVDGGVTDLAANPLSLSMEDIEALDLTMIKLKLQDTEEGPGWTPEQCDTVEAEYKRFLGLKRAYPEREIVPDRLVDIFWHQHILDTVKYAEDCQILFGDFLHHYPYFGMNGEEDHANLCAAFEETRHLHELHFGGWDQLSSAAKCRTKCKPVQCK